jgi:F-type H+-transporting ATPase subunit alpha
VNVGLSVSRVGGSAQVAAMKKVAGTLRLTLAQYRELAAFSQFASDMDKATQNQLARGARMVELLKQGQYQPLPVERQILVLFAGLNGFLDQLAIADIGKWERELYPWLESRRPDVLTTIRTKCTDGKAFNELQDLMKAALAEYNKEFAAQATSAAAAPQSAMKSASGGQGGKAAAAPQA